MLENSVVMLEISARATSAPDLITVASRISRIWLQVLNSASALHLLPVALMLEVSACATSAPDLITVENRLSCLLLQVLNLTSHEFHEACHSVTLYFMKKYSKRYCDTTTRQNWSDHQHDNMYISLPMVTTLHYHTLYNDYVHQQTARAVDLCNIYSFSCILYST